jgi:hypothetical protein
MKNPHFFFPAGNAKTPFQRYFSTQELYRVSRYGLWRRETCLECVVGHFREFWVEKGRTDSESLFTHTIPCRAPAAAVSFVKVRVLPERSELPIAKLRFVAGRNRTWADRPPAAERRAMIVHTYSAVPMPCCAVALRSLLQSGMVGALQSHGMVSVNEPLTSLLLRLSTAIAAELRNVVSVTMYQTFIPSYHGHFPSLLSVSLNIYSISSLLLSRDCRSLHSTSVIYPYVLMFLPSSKHPHGLGQLTVLNKGTRTCDDKRRCFIVSAGRSWR